MSAALRFSKPPPYDSPEQLSKQSLSAYRADSICSILNDFNARRSGTPKDRRQWHQGVQKTVGAGISPSASLSDQDTVAAATSVKSSRHAGLDFDGPASPPPESSVRSGPRRSPPLRALPCGHRRFLPSFMAASVRRRRWHAFRGPVGLGFRPSNRQACSRFGPYGPQEIRLSLRLSA
jgi:hypothetical protein